MKRLALCVVVVLVTNTAGKAGATVVAWYRFEDGTAGSTSSTILDSSSAGNNGTSFGTPVYSSDVASFPGLANTGSLEFDSSKTDYVSFASSFIFHNPGDATFEFSLKVPDQGHGAIVWSNPTHVEAPNRFHLWLSGSPEGVPQPGVVFGMDYVEPDGTRSSGLHRLAPLPHWAISLPINEWTHIAVTREGDTYNYYNDGSLIMQFTDTNPDLPTFTGWQLAGRSHDFTGLIDEVRMSTGALAPDELLFPGPNVVPEPSSLIVWSLIALTFGGVGWYRRSKEPVSP